MDYKNGFLNYLKVEKRYSLHTLKSYMADVGHFFEYLGMEEETSKVSLPKVDEKVIRDWIVVSLDSGLTTRTVNRRISTLKTFFKYLQREGILESNPAEKIIKPKNSKRLPVFVEKKQLIQLLDEYDFGKDFTGVRNKLIIELFYHTGMRLSELIGLTDNQIAKEDRMIKVLGKRSKERLIPYLPELNEIMDNYRLIRDNAVEKREGDYFFVTEKGKKLYPKLVYDVVVKYLSACTTIEKKSPHVLRHTFRNTHAKPRSRS